MKTVFVLVTLGGEHNQGDKDEETKEEKTYDDAYQSDHGFFPFPRIERFLDFTTIGADGINVKRNLFFIRTIKYPPDYILA